MRRTTLLFLPYTIIVFLASGCESPKSIPKVYFDGNDKMSVRVGECPEKPGLNSDYGGLIGAIADAVRARAMREATSGITSDTIKEVVARRFGKKIQEYFDVSEEGPLSAVIDIKEWGWQVRTVAVGIRTGSYQFSLVGTVTITDSVQKGKPIIARVRMDVLETIGHEPTADICRDALVKCADRFAELTVASLVRERAPESS